jgi:beta-barrel assembly-enhancing protease
MDILRGAIIVLTCLLVFGCATNPVTGKSQLMFVSEKQEISMGQAAAPALNWDFGGEYRDPGLEEYLRDIVNRIWAISERPELPVTFHIQNTSIPNALALPGYIAMTRGLLVGLENEAQFAAIMGHEAGHVMARHSASRVSRGVLAQLGLGVGGAVLGDTVGSEALMALGSVGTSLLLLKYDRSQELEADRLGVIYSSSLGYDPNEAITAHQRLELAVKDFLARHGKSSQSGGFLDAILSTHPRQEVRIDEIRQMIDNLPPYKIIGDGKFARDFMKMTSDVRTVNESYLVFDSAEQAFGQKDYDNAESLARKAIEMNSNQAPFYTLQGKIMLARGTPQGAIPFFEKSLSLYKDFQPAVFGLAVSEYKNSNFTNALGYVKQSLSLYPQHPGSLYVAGLSYHSLNMPKEALTHFSEFAEFAGKHPDVYGYMGINFEKINRIDLAIQAYTVQLQIAPDNAMGQLAKQRLAVIK